MILLWDCVGIVYEFLLLPTYIHCRSPAEPMWPNPDSATAHLPQSQLPWPSFRFLMPTNNPAAGSKLPAKCCNNKNPCLEACPNTKLRYTTHEGDAIPNRASSQFPLPSCQCESLSLGWFSSCWPFGREQLGIRWRRGASYRGVAINKRVGRQPISR